MENLDFTIITVTFNSEKTLARTIESVRNQSVKSFEYIVVDGNSTDRTKFIIEDNLDVIDRWISEDDQNMYDAINKGIKLARGKIVSILNSDDWLEYDALKIIYQCVKKHREAKLYVGQTLVVDPRCPSASKMRVQERRLPMPLAMPFDHQTCFFRLEAYEELGLYDTDFPLVSDYDFILRFMKSPYSYALAEGHTNNFTRGGMSSFRKSYKDIWRVLRKNGYDRFTVFISIAFRACTKILLEVRKKTSI